MLQQTYFDILLPDIVSTILQAWFKKVPKQIETAIRNMTDTIALQSWVEFAANCESLKEFEKAFR